MKTVVLAALLSLFGPTILFAQSGDMKGMDMKGHKCMDMMKDPACMDMMKKDHKGMDMKGMKSGSTGDAQVHKARGKVTKVDPAAGTVTIAHEPVPSMKWPSMIMAFKAQEKSALENLKPGSKVEFSFKQDGKDYVITELKK